MQKLIRILTSSLRWKLFLPEQWREACAVNADGNMDPNLTLAHITHNTAVVLLHQGMAYPSPIWQSTSIRLPSASSAETCIAAAIEVSTIAEHYLRNSRFLANHQFAFCLFVCGRMLLAHANYFQIALATLSFDSLVLSLREIAARWGGESSYSGPSNGPSSPSSTNLASKFASRLREARDMGATTYDIRQAAYSEQGQSPSRRGTASRGPISEQHAYRGEMEHGAYTAAEHGEAQVGWSPAQVSVSGRTEGSASDNLTLAFPPLPQALQQQGQQMQMQGRATMPVVMNGSGGPEGMSRQPHGATQTGEEQPMLEQDLDDIYAYLDGTFLPAQRISIYSQ